MVMVEIEIKELAADINKAELLHYRMSGLNNYWLSPALFDRNAEGEVRLLDFDHIQAAIGMHIAALRRPLGPREIRFLRKEMDVSQSQLGRLLGYKDKQRVAAAEKSDAGRKPLVASADMLLRHHYLHVLGLNAAGNHGLVGAAYRSAALALSEALNRGIFEVDQTDHLLAAA
jgi:DNA-binding transcriptional regulator YiaG